ncbi:hypothetical protein BDV06DRAFT_84834 [Aspergillus oleicola]
MGVPALHVRYPRLDTILTFPTVVAPSPLASPLIIPLFYFLSSVYPESDGIRKRTCLLRFAFCVRRTIWLSSPPTASRTLSDNHRHWRSHVILFTSQHDLIVNDIDLSLQFRERTPSPSRSFPERDFCIASIRFGSVFPACYIILLLSFHIQSLLEKGGRNPFCKSGPCSGHTYYL